jgi:hypothetical protein
MDAPELVVLLQAAGFSLRSLGFPGSEASGRGGAVSGGGGGPCLGGCRVVLECGVSGLRAELSSPPDAACRCSLFSKTKAEPHELREQASFWHVTTSQVWRLDCLLENNKKKNARNVTKNYASVHKY